MSGAAENTFGKTRLRAVYGRLRELAHALRALRDRGFREVTVFSPAALPEEIRALLPHPGSPVRFLSLAAAMSGAFIGFAMSVGSALTYGLIVGGKHPPSLLPYAIPGFEFTILLGGLTAFFGLAFLARLSPYYASEQYDPSYNEDRFALLVDCPSSRAAEVTALLREAGAEQVYEQPIVRD